MKINNYLKTEVMGRQKNEKRTEGFVRLLLLLGVIFNIMHAVIVLLRVSEVGTVGQQNIYRNSHLIVLAVILLGLLTFISRKKSVIQGLLTLRDELTEGLWLNFKLLVEKCLWWCVAPMLSITIISSMVYVFNAKEGMDRMLTLIISVIFLLIFGLTYVRENLKRKERALAGVKELYAKGTIPYEFEYSYSDFEEDFASDRERLTESELEFVINQPYIAINDYRVNNVERVINRISVNNHRDYFMSNKNRIQQYIKDDRDAKVTDIVKELDGKFTEELRKKEKVQKKAQTVIREYLKTRNKPEYYDVDNFEQTSMNKLEQSMYLTNEGVAQLRVEDWSEDMMLTYIEHTYYSLYKDALYAYIEKHIEQEVFEYGNKQDFKAYVYNDLLPREDYSQLVENSQVLHLAVTELITPYNEKQLRLHLEHQEFERERKERRRREVAQRRSLSRSFS